MLPAAADLGNRPRDACAKPRKISPPRDQNFRRYRRQLLVVALHQCAVKPVLAPQQRIFVFKQLFVPPERSHISGRDLRDRRIEKLAPLRRCALDDRQMIRTEQHRTEDAERLARRDLHAVFCPPPRPAEIAVAERLFFAAAGKGDVNPAALCAEPHKIALARRAEGSAPRKKVDGFKHVGLALGVVAVEQIDSGIKMNAFSFRRAEIFKRDRLEDHYSFMRSGSTM